MTLTPNPDLPLPLRLKDRLGEDKKLRIDPSLVLLEYRLRGSLGLTPRKNNYEIMRVVY